MSANSGVAALRLANLRKAYGDVIAVNGLNLEVPAGQCFGLLGPNGAGKTTTIEICEGLTTPDPGVVEVLGRTWAREGDALRQRLGIQLQDTQFADKLTVFETVRLFRSSYHQGPAPDEVIALVQLEEKRAARVITLSGGQKQRLALWRLLVLVVEVGVPVAFGAWAFGVPVRGSLPALVVISVVASLSFSAQALLISSRARTIEAASGMVNLVQVPMWILSRLLLGTEVSRAIQPVIAALPLIALNDALRAHMLQGAGRVNVAPQLGVLAAWLVICFALALRLFRWR